MTKTGLLGTDQRAVLGGPALSIMTKAGSVLAGSNGPVTVSGCGGVRGEGWVRLEPSVSIVPSAY